MRPDSRFLGQPEHFWAIVRSVSEQVGYTARKTKRIHTPDAGAIVASMNAMSMNTTRLMSADGVPSPLLTLLEAYFAHRADSLNNFVYPRLMNKERAAAVYKQILTETRSTLPVTMNKQKGEKKKPSYLSGIVSMIIEANLGGLPCNYNPKSLTRFTQDQFPVKTLVRRFDGAFPSVINPIAMWEIKEYYNTKTFGSRVSDGVYVSILDGIELERAKEHQNINCLHYLIVDDLFTWWDCGRPYLCRIIDMLHMGQADEVLFGYEVVERLPDLAKQWVELHRIRVNAAQI